MDKRQKSGHKRTNGAGPFSSGIATPFCSSFIRSAKAHRACAFAIALCAAPIAALAEDSGRTQTVIVDVASKGSLGAVCMAVVMWLNSQRKERAQSRDRQRIDINRQPPLGEDVARTYATKDDLSALDTKVSKDISDLRASIAENDRQAELRAKGTHQRIDALYRESLKGTRALGMLIGIMVGKGIAPASMATATTEEG